jgi:hypothetical protein
MNPKPAKPISKGAIMKKLTYSILGTVLACILCLASTAWAGATFTPVSGIMHYDVVDDGKQWLDEEGILHIRGALMEWEALAGEGSFVGTGWGIYNTNIDPVTGDGDTQAFHYLDFSLGELSGTFGGHSDSIYEGFVMTGEFVANGDGGFAGMKLRTDVTLVSSSGLASYDGILHDPQGGDEDKAGSEKSSTWGAVKDLYK